MRAAALIPLFALACNPGEDTGDTGDTVPLEPFDAATAERLDAALTAVLEQHPATGLQAAVLLPGREGWVGNAGLANLDGDQPWAIGHASKAGSITKTVTASLVLSAVQDGALSLDDAASAHLTDFPWGDTITVRHLLQHSSGIPEYAGALEIAGDQDESWSLAELVDLVAVQGVSFEAGSRYAYANTNYVVLGLILEELGDQPWQDQATAILRDIGEGSLRVPSQGEGWGQVVPGYLMLPDGSAYEHDTGNDWSSYWHADAIASAGNLVGDAPGLAAWGRALWIDETVLDSATVEAMVGDTVPVGSGYAYGLGTVVDDTTERTRWFHNGAVTGYASWLDARPDDGAVVAVVSNNWLVDGGYFSSDWLMDARDQLWDALDGVGGD